MEVSANCLKLTRYYFSPTERPDSLLCNQLQQAQGVLDTLVTRPLFSFQQEALLCLLSDVIAGYAESPVCQFPASFMVKALNRGMFQVAAGEFYTFSFLHGQFDLRAYSKRQAEQLLFSRGLLLFP